MDEAIAWFRAFLDTEWAAKTAYHLEDDRDTFLAAKRAYKALKHKKSVPLGAGVSGSTQRLFKECKMLNVSGAKRIRLAAVGWLLLLHHSFEEIMIACANNGAGAYGGNADYLALDPPGRGALEGIGPIPGAASPRP
jgi:hypothetical protein